MRIGSASLHGLHRDRIRSFVNRPKPETGPAAGRSGPLAHLLQKEVGGAEHDENDQQQHENNRRSPAHGAVPNRLKRKGCLV
jgi:hypothetical protein